MAKKYWKSQGILSVRKSGNHGQVRLHVGVVEYGASGNVTPVSATCNWALAYLL